MVAPLAEIIVRGARTPRLAHREGVVFGMILRVDAAVVTHLDHPQLVAVEHRMGLKLFGDPVNGRFHPEERTTFDAGKGLFLVQHLLVEGLVGEQQPRLVGDGILGADIGAEPALQAGILLEAQLRKVGVVAKRARGAERDAGQA